MPETRGSQIQAYFDRLDSAVRQIAEDAEALPPAVWREAKHDAVAHHVAHFQNLPIKETSVCPFKIASWYGFALSRKAAEHGIDPERKILLAIISVMVDFLRVEGISMPGTTTTLLWTMAKNHGNEDMEDFAIGPNGLYAGFLTPRTVRR